MLAGQTSVTSPVFDVSRYAYLAGTIGENLASAVVTLTWYLDSAGTTKIASRVFTVTDSITNAMQLRVPNLGSFCQVALTNTGTGIDRTVAQVFGTNRVHPLEFLPMYSVLIDLQGIALGAGASYVAYPTDYYAGPVDIYFYGSQVNQLVPKVLNTAGIWDTIEYLSEAGNVNVSKYAIMPDGAWRMDVTNTNNVAGTFNLVVTSSMTGAG